MSRLWTALGGFPDAAGAAFAVWAPHAREIRVIGDFAGWGADDGVALTRDDDGVWRGRVGGARLGQRYKYKVHGADGSWRDRADPMAVRTECPPATASVLHRSAYEWNDAQWLAERRGDVHCLPMSVYEVHLGSWRHGMSYAELADDLSKYVSDLGFTHVELMPVMEHPFGGSWGYQVTSYFAPTARHGTPDDFRYFVDRMHQAGIGVILDWVPAHFPRDDWALARFDGTPLYEYADWRRGEHPDWGSLVFDYGRPEVRAFLIASARYWCEEYHVDGLRVDAVASLLYLDYSRGYGQWEPNRYGGNVHLEAVDFLRELTCTVYRENPGVVMIAEESTAWPGVSRPVDWGGLGFGLKWNMGWMHDTLAYLSREPVFRRFHHDQLTWPSVYAFDEQFLLPISHDEVVHGKRSLAAKLPGDRWQRLAGLRGLLGYMWAFPGKHLLFAGCELADEREWSELHGMDWSLLSDPGSNGVRDTLRDVNRLYLDTPALWSQDGSPAGFQWIAWDDRDGNVLAFLRWGSDGSVLACVVNFSGNPKHRYRIGLPRAGRWLEVLNTDATCYGGSGVGNLGRITALGPPRHGQPVSAALEVGPYAAHWFRPARPDRRR